MRRVFVSWMIATLIGCGEAPTVAPDAEQPGTGSVEETLLLTEERITTTYDGQAFRLTMKVPDDWINWDYRYFFDFEVVAELEYLSGGITTNAEATARFADLDSIYDSEASDFLYHMIVPAPAPDEGEEPLPTVTFRPKIEVPNRAAKLDLISVWYNEETGEVGSQIMLPRWIHDRAAKADVEVTVEHTYVSGGGTTVTTISQTELMSEMESRHYVFRPFKAFLTSSIAGPAPDDIAWVNTSLVATAVP